MKFTYLSVVIPAFNEERGLESSLNQVVSFLRNRDCRFEVILVDDGSTDRTPEIAEASTFESESSCLRVLTNSRNRGKGYSVRKGMLEVRGSFALLCDSDLSTPIEEVVKLEEAVSEQDFDIVLGSRDIAGSEVLERQSWFRENSGKLFNRFVRILTPLPFKDTQCGFKLFKMKTCRAIFEKQKIRRYAFDVEILYIARKWDLKMLEVPIIWRHAEGSKVRMFPDGPLMLRDLLLIHWNSCRGFYSAG
jgi:dolichyl-phosphate beta-glucosyltransferase